MFKSILKWVIPLVALLLLGPPACMCTSGLRLADGSHHATLLVSTTPLKGIILGLVAVAMATGIGAVASRLIGTAYGLFCAGLTLAWAAWGTGTLDEVIRSTQSRSSMWRLSVEGAIIGVAGVVASALIVIAGKAHDRALQPPPPSGASNSKPTLFRTVIGEADEHDGGVFKNLGIAAAACLITGGVTAWFIAAESLKGQSFAAAAIAGMIGALAAKLAARSIAPTVSFIAVAVLACVGPAAAAMMASSDAAFVREVYAGTVMPLARIMPLDWLAGALVGVPIGLSWGLAMTEPHAHTA